MFFFVVEYKDLCAFKIYCYMSRLPVLQVDYTRVFEALDVAMVLFLSSGLV